MIFYFLYKTQISAIMQMILLSILAENITHKLENDCNVALQWFADNFMKSNADKCHLLVLGQRCDYPVTVKIGNTDVVNSSQEKLLGVHIDSKLSVTPRSFAKKPTINFMHLPAYPRT